MTTLIPSHNLTQRFINGLTKYNLTLNEIQNSKWKYCGGDKGSHYNYFKLYFKDKEKDISKNISHKDYCICGTGIIENCYITDNIQILVLGNCCIKKFIYKSSRTCEICDEPHKNRKVNRCNDCRIGICDDCNSKCNPRYKKCYDCHNNNI